MNIIVIIADTYRYDNIFPLDANAVGGPHLEAFAQQGVSLSNFFIGSFPTIPQRTDFTTGRVGWPWYPWQPLPLSGRNHLPRLLRDHGYVSQLLGDCPHLIKARFDLGFDGFYHLPGQEGDTYFLRMNRAIQESMPPAKTRGGSHFLDAQSARPAPLDQPVLRARSGNFRFSHIHGRHGMAGRKLPARALLPVGGLL